MSKNEGHTIITQGEGNGGWLKKLLMWDFSEIQCKEYPGWERLNGDEICAVFMERVWGKDETSHDLDVKFDDIAKGQFYSRDWSASGTPGVSDGDTYWSMFYFQLIEDGKKFQELYGGVGSWNKDEYKAFVAACNDRRDNYYKKKE